MPKAPQRKDILEVRAHTPKPPLLETPLGEAEGNPGPHPLPAAAIQDPTARVISHGFSPQQHPADHKRGQILCDSPRPRVHPPVH